ncbi:MAG TPA: PKD domain-containing protein [Gemmataceae bacterium]|nr:PKD domain-containing protein [Gemmataceae bacterium]
MDGISLDSFAPLRLCVRCLFVFLLAAIPVRAADPWHLADWQARVVVEIPKPLAEPGVDTAAVRVLCQGLAKADGSDYRVLDAAGKPVPFQLTFHDAARYSLLSFRAADTKGRFFVYFGNPKAERAKEQVVVDPKPGAGPPKGEWVPRYGLVLETVERPEGKNPETVEDMAKLLAGSKAKHGARYQRRISDGYNPFGSSDYYMSIYRGWINIPKAGKYEFCTASNEASFSFLDGKELVHWPGRHTAERGLHGEKNAAIDLTAGVHYVEYYHEEVVLDQMAFLGWRPAGATYFGAIPESVYTAPHPAVVTAYETPKGPPLRFEPVISDSAWPAERREGQYTRCRFAAGKTPPLPDGTTYRWDFGDGQAATGPEVEHVYLALGTYPVTLTAQGPQGTATAKWPLTIFEIEHVTDEYREGRPKDYAKIAGTYDRAKLDADSLKELAHLLAESEEPAKALEVGKEFVSRFPNAKPQTLARVRRLNAECALRLGKEGLDEAVKSYQESITKDTPPVERLDVLARLIRLVGIERGEPEKAAAVIAQVEEAWKAARADEDTQAAYRRAVIASGDVLLWNGKLEGARDFYKRAEALGTFIPSQVRNARIGAYPNSIKEFIAAGNLGAALDVVSQWEETFPTDKPNGQTFFWHGKLLELRGQHHDAARHLARAVSLTVGASFESEARWLLAESLEQIGRKEEAKKELAKLVASGINDEFAKKAKDRLQKALGEKKP